MHARLVGWSLLVSSLALWSCQGSPQESPESEPQKGPEKAAEMPAEGGQLEAGGRYGGRGPGPERLKERGPETGEAVEAALKWLASHQDEGGRWSAKDFMKHDPAGDKCDGAGGAVHDIGATGLALLAFLANGNTLRVGPYRDTVKQAVKWLKDQQQENGLIGEPSTHAYMYNHGIATVALVEAYGLSAYKILKKHAQGAVDYICQARNPYKVWRYYPKDGQNDSSVTGWMVAALASAKSFELDVDVDALKFAEAWYEEVTDPNTGQLGYTKRGEPSSRIAGTSAKFPVSETEALTASGLFHRILLGQAPKTHPVLMTAADSCLRKLPEWEPEAGRVDYYYWYYGSYGMFQLGGKHWLHWKRALRKALVPNQRHDGSAKGSWDPVGPWGREGGRVYSTALACLSLQTYYRYTRLIR